MNRVIAGPASPFKPLYEEAYNALRDAILDGRLIPGERIVEAEIARQMAISRAPIREAIRKLERDGLVQYLPRRGAVVVKLSRDEVRDVYYLRAHLEAYAIRLSAVRRTPADLAALEELLLRMRESAARDDLPGLIAADVQFHATICQASGSKRLYQLWDSLNPHSWTLLTSLKATGYTPLQIAGRHAPLLEALREGDPDQAEDEVRRHITELADNILANWSPDQGTKGT